MTGGKSDIKVAPDAALSVFFYSNVENMEFKELYLNGYNCNDYDASGGTIDGVMFQEDISKLTKVEYIRIDE